MNNRIAQVGYSQRIRLEWLEFTANLVLAGNDEASIYSALQALLKDKLSVEGDAPRGNREKAISILMKVWVRPPKELSYLRREGLVLLSNLPRHDHIAVHWGMLMAVYPFWGAVAAHVGRLLRLQGTVALSQVQQRICEHYGERETVSRATRRVLRSFVDWGVLRDTPSKGIYTYGLSKEIKDRRLISWLIEAVLHTQPESPKELQVILNSTSLFPFHIKPISAIQLIEHSENLDAFQSDNNEFLMLKRR